MKGNGVYFAFASLLGVTAALVDRTYSFIGLCLLLLLLLYFKKWPVKMVSVLIAVCITVFFRSELAEDNQATKISIDQTVFSLRFEDKIKIDGDFLSAEVQSEHGERLMLRYEIESEHEKEILTDALHPGLVCSMKGQLEESSAATNPNGFDYQLYLQRNGIYWIFEAGSLSLTQCSSELSSPVTFFQKLRYDGITYINNHFPEQSAGLAAALIFGDRNGIDHDIITSYERLGTVHLLAISGLHVAMLAGLIFYLGLRIGFTRESMIYFLLFLLPVYALLTGAAPSVNRAVLMLMLGLAARRFHVYFSTSDIISSVFIGYIFLSPYSLFNIGLQLSFFITFALILSAPALSKKAINSFLTGLQTSFICLLSSLPFMFNYFYEVSLISLVVNLIYIPLYSWVLMPGLLVLFFVHLALGERIDFLIGLFDLFIGFVNSSSEWLADLPFAVLTLGTPPAFVLVLYAAGNIAFFAIWEKGTGYRFFIKIVLIPASVMLIHYTVNTYSLYGEVTMIDVGQGDSIFIQLPYGGGNYLIDTGGSFTFPEEKWREKEKPFEVGRDTITPFLKSKGVRTIDKLIITHGDADHIGGSKAILKEFNVKEILLAAEIESSDAERELAFIAKNKDINVQYVRAGMGWKSGKSIFQIILPGENTVSEGENNSSIVFYAKIGGLSWLFTGDIEDIVESNLIEQYPGLRADVLKVAHHGSKTSSSVEFLQSIQPHYALISAGRNNLYGHPHMEIIERYNEEKIVTFRTDLNGAITYKFKEGQGTFFTVLP